MLAKRIRNGEKMRYAMTAIYMADGALLLFDGHTLKQWYMDFVDDHLQPLKIVSDEVEIADLLTDWRIPYELDELEPDDTFHVYLSEDEYCDFMDTI